MNSNDKRGEITTISDGEGKDEKNPSMPFSSLSFFFFFFTYILSSVHS